MHIKRLDSTIFLILLASLVLLRPLVVYATTQEFPESPLLLSIQPFISPAYFILVAVCALFAVFSIRQIFRYRGELLAAIRQTRLEEEQHTSQRRAAFGARHPRLAGFPLIGSLAYFIAGEGVWVWLTLLILLAAGLFLRLWNLDALAPYADEYRHLVAAKQLLSGEALSQLEYRRSLYTVTLPVFLSFKAIGASLWSARFAGVVVHLLAVIPLYLLVRRVSKLAAVLAVGLYLLDPWLILTSRLVREYAYYSFYFFSLLLVMVWLLESLPERIQLPGDLRRMISWRTMLLSGVLLFALLYAFSIDGLSTFRTVGVIYPALFFLLLARLDWRLPASRIAGILALAALGLVLVMLVRSAGNAGSILTGRFTLYYINLFYESPIQQMYYLRTPIALIVLGAGLFGMLAWAKGQRTATIFFLVYLLAMLAFATLALKDYRTRYGVSLQFWHILVMAIGLYALIQVLKKHLRQPWLWGLGVIFVLLLYWNIPHSLTPARHTQPGYHPISEDHHPDLAPAYAYLQQHAGQGEALVAAEIFILYLDWMDGAGFDPVVEYVYDIKNPQQVIYNTIESNPHGWIVMEYRTGYVWTRPLPLEDFEHAGKQVRYLGWFGDQYLYRW